MHEITQVTQQLQKNLYKYWSTQVPAIFKSTSGIGNERNQQCYDEQELQMKLLGPLNTLLFGEDVTPKQLAESLGISNARPGSVCGYVFKSGEPTYSCRECATDPTCVMCYGCFSKSVHKNHKYRMATSSGSGYCDCGDTEAWTVDPFCQLHDPQNVSQEPSVVLPSSMEKNVECVLSFVLNYCVNVVCWDYSDVLPTFLEATPCAVPFHTMLFNDESHTYDEVIKALTKALECTEEQAMHFATVVDREGRCSVYSGNKEKCTRTKQIIEQRTSKNNKTPLLVEVMDSCIVAHQAFALRLLPWLVSLVQELPPLLQTVCNLLMKQTADENDEQSIICKIMRRDVKLWKGARVAYHQLLMATVLMDFELKKQFSCLFTRMYGDLIQDYITDDHDHSLSITSLTVQTFTVPTIAKLLIAEENVLHVILKQLINNCEKHIKNGKLTFERNQISLNFKRSLHVISDLKYILTSVPDKWSADLRKNFLVGMSTLLDFLSLMNEMDNVVRQTGQHQEFEPEWETAYNIQLRMGPVVLLIQKWCASDEEVAKESFKLTFERVHGLLNYTKLSHVKVASHTSTCIAYDVHKQPVSIHLPLLRLLAGLYMGLLQHRENLEHVLAEIKLPVDVLLEWPLRVQVMIAQSHAGLWRRNGYSLLNQILNTCILDKDVLLLQVCAAHTDSDEFLIRLLNKFGLITWCSKDSEMYLSEHDAAKAVVTMIEEFLHLIIVIVAERFLPFVADVSKDDALRREVVHLLCKGPSTFSQLDRHLPEDPSERTGLENVINSVANFRQPIAGGAGLFELKPDLRVEYSSFFFHYSKTDQSMAELVQRKQRKDSGLDLLACPPPLMPNLTAHFQNVAGILNCDTMLQVISVVLDNALESSKFYSDGQLHRVLYLIGMALNEECAGRCEETAVFSKRAISWRQPNPGGILELLERIASLPKFETNFNDLLKWTIKKFKFCLDAQTVSHMESSLVPSEEVENDQESRKRRCQIADARRKKAMEQMAKLQKSFIKKHCKELEISAIESSREIDDVEQLTSSFSCAFGSTVQQVSKKITCVLCMDEQEVQFSGKAIVLAAYVQNSTLFSKSRGKLLDTSESYTPLFVSAALHVAPHVSTCGHAMHSECWQLFFDSVVAREQRRPLLRMRALVVDVDRGEYLCPLCKRLSNTVLPLFPALGNLSLECVITPTVPSSYEQWLLHLKEEIQKNEIPAPKTVRKRTKTSNNQSNSSSSVSLDNEMWVEVEMADVSDDNSDTGMQQQQSIQETIASYARILNNISRVIGHSLPSADGSVHERKLNRHPISNSNFEMLKTFSQAIYMTSLNCDPHPGNSRVPIFSWFATAYTIRCIDAALIFERRPLFGALSSRQKDCLYPLVRFAALCNLATKNSIVRACCLQLLDMLLAPAEQVQQYPCILEIDLFSIMVELCYCSGYLYATSDQEWVIPTGGEQEHHVLQLCLSAHLVQLVLCSDLTVTDETNDATAMEQDSPACEPEQDAVTCFCNWIWSYADESHYSRVRFSSIDHGALREKLIPFLRQCALFFHALTLVPPPEALKDPSIDVFFPLCRYLNIPTSLEGIIALVDRSLAARWLTHDTVKKLLKSGNVVKQPVNLNNLVSLPTEFSSLINEAAHFSCPSLNIDDSRTPTLCLICGEMLCSQGYCCQKALGREQVGACTYHSAKCNCEVGLFLRIRDCQLLLLYQRHRGCFLPAPYVDEYGETDQGFRRGNPLFLSPERFHRLHMMWVNHTIQEDLVNRLDYHTNLLTTDWHHL